MADQASRDIALLEARLEGAADILSPRLDDIVDSHEVPAEAVAPFANLLAAALVEGCHVGLVEAQAQLVEQMLAPAPGGQ